MKLFRNGAFRREFMTCAVISVVCAAAAFFVRPLAAVPTAVCGAAFCTAHYLFSKKRYSDIALLSDTVDRILHGETAASISSSEEGELSVLASEIQKMTLRLKEQSDRLAAEKLGLTDAIADIFHQMRTPLTSMNLVVSLLSEPEVSDEKRLDLARQLRRQLERMQWQIETLLKMSKIDAGTAVFRPENISAADLISRAAEPLVIPMELRGISFEPDAGDARVDCDLSWTAEALGNIFKNCAEHTPEGGRITVRAAETPLYSEIVITDTGEGFDPEDIPHLFERFYKGKNASDQSIGIGLAFCRMVAAAQNGTVTAANAPGGGASFTVRFYKSVI